jgi:dipeptidyl aminopeptidase/acylaminoacyl peptidase
MLCPAYRSGRDGNYMAGLLELIEQARAAYPKIDPKRIYCTGFSMGGFASAQLAAFHGEVFAAVSCGGGAGQLAWVDKIRIPVQVVQGGADSIVKPEGVFKAVEKMKEAGLSPEVHVIPFANHEYLPEQFMNWAMDFFDKHVKK